MSRWKSRWSRPRFRNTATSKANPPTRPITSAWLETSIAQASTPLSTICRNSRCRSGASGVVRADATSSPSIRVPTVPITAAGTPAPVSPPSSRRVVVVLPWVPVTPTIRSRVAGSPYTIAATRPRTGRISGYDEHRRCVHALGTFRIGDDRDRAGLVGLLPVVGTVRRGCPAARRRGRPARPGGSRGSRRGPWPRRRTSPAPHRRDRPGRGPRRGRRASEPGSAEAAARDARHGPEAIGGPGRGRRPRRAEGRGVSDGHHVVGISEALAPVGGTP